MKSSKEPLPLLHKGQVSIIVATGRNREIGAKNKLLWKIPEELKRFKEITTGHPIIMGRKTHESIGRILPNRTNIIVTRDSGYFSEGAVISNSLEDAISKAQESEGSEEIFIIGGAQIFAQALPLANKLYLTLVDADFSEADSFFPEYEDKFTKRVFEKSEESSGYKYKFMEFEK